MNVVARIVGGLMSPFKLAGSAKYELEWVPELLLGEWFSNIFRSTFDNA